MNEKLELILNYVLDINTDLFDPENGDDEVLPGVTVRDIGILKTRYCSK